MATTDILIDICRGSLKPKNAANGAEAAPDHGPSVMSYLGMDRVTGLFTDATAVAAPIEDTTQTQSPETAGCPSPSTFFALFADHPKEFVRFLETVTADEPAVWNTLLELYLTPGSEDTAKAARMLQSTRLDPVHALILCNRADFVHGSLILWEQMGMHEDVLRHWMSRPGASEEVIRYLDRHGPDHPELYTLALRYLTSSPGILSEQKDQLARILGLVDEKHILPPLAIIQLLSRNSVTTIGSLRSWLKQKVEETNAGIESDQQLVNSYRTETKEKMAEMQTLADPEKPQVFQVTKCAACGGQLDLPTVHFMCKHSYHQRQVRDAS